MKKKWYEQKTTWTALTGIAVAIASYASGQIELTATIEAVFAGLGLIFARQAIEGTKGK